MVSVLAICALAIVGLQAQKFGYVNSAELLASLPEVKAADAELETFQNQLIAQGQDKVKSFEDNYRAYRADVEAGTLSQVQMAEREQTLATEQKGIQDFEKEVQLKVLQKREELLQPILERIDTIIKDIGKEGGYTFIFDSSAAGAMLYAPDGDNIIDQIKAKLGTQ